VNEARIAVDGGAASIAARFHAPPSGVAASAAVLIAEAHRAHRAPRDVRASRIGHFGFFRETFEPTLWQRALGLLRDFTPAKERTA
jgi:predicted alpha/beta hydrolase